MTNKIITFLDFINEIETKKEREKLRKSSLEAILEKEKSCKTFRGFYLDKDISKMLDMLSKKGGKGAISKIVNTALRRYLTEQGVLK